MRPAAINSSHRLGGAPAFALRGTHRTAAAAPPNRALAGTVGGVACLAASPAGGSSRSAGVKLGSALGSTPPTQFSFGRRFGQHTPQGGAGASASTCSLRSLVLYSAALEYARDERFDVARRVFAKLVEECPGFLKPWVSWAQMEKRCIPHGDERRWRRCAAVLQRGLELNRDAPPLLQAWGLNELQVWGRAANGDATPCCSHAGMGQVLGRVASPSPLPPPLCSTLLQRGNIVAAILLLDRSAALEPRNRPVLRWKPVIEARRTASARSTGVRRAYRRSTCAARAAGDE